MNKVRKIAELAEISKVFGQTTHSNLHAITIDLGDCDISHLSRKDVSVYIYGEEETVRKYPNLFKTCSIAERHCRTGKFYPDPSPFQNGGFKSHEEITWDRIVAAATNSKKFSPPKVSKR